MVPELNKAPRREKISAICEDGWFALRTWIPWNCGPNCEPQPAGQLNQLLLNHELLQNARQGNVAGLTAALDKGAWTETRRPLVMKPQKPDVNRGGMGKNDAQEPSHFSSLSLPHCRSLLCV